MLVLMRFLSVLFARIIPLEGLAQVGSADQTKAAPTGTPAKKPEKFPLASIRR